MVNGFCSCGDKSEKHSPGKHPRTPRGFKDATTDLATIERWWEMWPDANIGMATGKDSGVWVLDIDTRWSDTGEIIKDGDADLDALCKGRKLPATVAQVTGSAVSRHLFFAWDDDHPVSNRQIGALDVRGEGGYVLLPPSNHESGHHYQWMSAPDAIPPSATPEWLVDEFGAQAPEVVQAELLPFENVQAPEGVTENLTLSHALEPANLTLSHALEPARAAEIREALHFVPPALGYEDWVKVAMGLHDECAGSDEGFQIFHEWSARAAGQVTPTGKPAYKGESDCRKKWTSFHSSAAAGQRSASSIFELAWKDPRFAQAMQRRGQVAPTTEAETPAWMQPANGMPKAAGDDEKLLMTVDQVMNLRPAEPIVQGVIGRGELAMVYGAPGCGKSFVVLSLACCIAAGEPWFDRRVIPGTVIYGALEGLVGMQKRLLALRGGYEGLGALGDLWFTRQLRLNDPGSIFGFRTALQELNSAPALIIVDTLSRALPGADENQAKDMTLAVDACYSMQQQFGSAVLLVHHTRKGGDVERGSTVFTGAVDRKIKVVRKEGDPHARIDITGEKAKDDANLEPLSLTLEPVTLHELPEDDFGDRPTSCKLTLAEVPEGSTIVRMQFGDEAAKVMEMVEEFAVEGVPVNALAAELAMPKRSVQRAVNKLEKADMVERKNVRGYPRVFLIPKD